VLARKRGAASLGQLCVAVMAGSPSDSYVRSPAIEFVLDIDGSSVIIGAAPMVGAAFGSGQRAAPARYAATM
jgi:hypothetical protein